MRFGFSAKVLADTYATSDAEKRPQGPLSTEGIAGLTLLKTLFVTRQKP